MELNHICCQGKQECYCKIVIFSSNRTQSFNQSCSIHYTCDECDYVHCSLCAFVVAVGGLISFLALESCII